MWRRISAKLGLCMLVASVGIGCAQRVALRNAPDIPAAIGEARITQDQNRNAIVDLDIRHLAPPENLKPPRNVYVVWSQSPEGKNLNLGQLIVGGDRRGTLKSPTPMQIFRIIVTAEESPTVVFPSQHIVFSSDTIRAG